MSERRVLDWIFMACVPHVAYGLGRCNKPKVDSKSNCGRDDVLPMLQPKTNKELSDARRKGRFKGAR